MVQAHGMCDLRRPELKGPQVFPGPVGWVLRARGAGDGAYVSHPLRLSLQVECKAIMVFFHYCVVSNYFWLFIEGLYLFTLLVETFFPERRYFYWYTMVGWGRSPAQASGPRMSRCPSGSVRPEEEAPRCPR